jgi:leucyl aminopeptidase
LAKLQQTALAPSVRELKKHSHILCVLPKSNVVAAGREALDSDRLRAALARRRMKPGELAKSGVTGELAHGAAVSWVMLDAAASGFEQVSAMRKALAPLLAEQPAELAIAVAGNATQRRAAAELALYCAWVNGVRLPERKKKSARRLARIALFGHAEPDDFEAVRAQAEGNFLCRELTALPPNELTPAQYRGRIQRLAAEMAWEHEAYGLDRLEQMGAGAFAAVARGSPERDAAIVHLRYRGAHARKRIALVGKGICFDTGGHNLKPANSMQGMHRDMNGSAVCLGALLAASRTRLDADIDLWLAIAQNHISPSAYQQNEVVTALNGTHIEIVHTDAEGRMVLADALTLAARSKPDVIIDFATLTGSMKVALGNRYSGVLGNRDALLAQALAAGRASGERVSVFPLDADYDEALASDIADVKQCSLEGTADHILAARFLSCFVDGLPWLHMDLSAAICRGGLGAVATDVTGFGVGWVLEMLRTLIRE